MLTAQDIMTTDVVTLSPETEIPKAARLMLDRRINGLPVVRDGKLVGILCQSDLVAQQKRLSLPTIFTFLDGYIPLSSMKTLEKEVNRISALKVEQAMTAGPVTVSPDTSLEEVATIMVDRNYHTIPVVDEGRLVGVIGKEDVIKTLVDDH